MKTISTERPTITTTVVTDGEGFTALEGEWEELYRESPVATPFQSWAWLYSWWEHYGDPYELRLVLMRDGGGDLVGIVPLVLERRAPGAGRLLFAGAGVTDYLDLLAREGWEGEVAEAGVLALRGMGGWGVADLQELRPQAAAWDLFARWEGPKSRLAHSACSVLEARPWDEVLASLKKNYRSEVRRAMRRAEKEGVRVFAAGPDSAEDAARRLLGLHREWWRDRGISREHLSERFEGHLCSAAGRASRAGIGVVYESRRGGEVILSNFMLLGKDCAYGYMLGTRKGAFKGWSYNALFLRGVLEAAYEHDLGWADLLRGEETYKDRWNTFTVQNHRAILGRRAPSFLPYTAYHALRLKAKEYARSEDTLPLPRKALLWLKEARRG